MRFVIFWPHSVWWVGKHSKCIPNVNLWMFLSFLNEHTIFGLHFNLSWWSRSLLYGRIWKWEVERLHLSVHVRSIPYYDVWCFQLILTYSCLFFLYGVCLWFVDRTKRLQGPLRWHLHITDGFWNRDCSRQCSIAAVVGSVFIPKWIDRRIFWDAHSSTF